MLCVRTIECYNYHKFRERFDMSRRSQLLLSLIINGILVVLACIGAVMSVQSHGSVQSSLLFYTQDSNIFLGIAALIYVIAVCRAICSRTYAVPGWVQKLKYFAVCCVAVTLFVVVFILAPMASSLGGLRWIMLTGCMLYQHLLSPVTAIILFLLFEKQPVLPFRMTLMALIPTLIYAAVLYPLNIADIVDGTYPFLQVRGMSIGMSVLWFFILLVLAYVLAFMIWLLNRKIRVGRMQMRR